MSVIREMSLRAMRPTTTGRETFSRAGGRAVDISMSGVGVLAYVFLYLPIVTLIVYSFDRSDFTANWKGFTWHWYSVLFHDSVILHALKVSLIIAASSAIVSTVVGTLTAVAVGKRAFRGRAAFMGLLFLPLLLPEIVLSIAFLTLLSHAHVALGYGSLIAGHIVLTLPYSTLLLLGATTRIDPYLEEAARDLGSTAITAFMRVTLPLLLPAIFGALLLSFTVSFGDVVMSNFVSGVGTTTLPVQVYGLLKTGVTPEINALGALLVAVTLITVVVIGVRQLAGGLSMSRPADDTDAG